MLSSSIHMCNVCGLFYTKNWSVNQIDSSKSMSQYYWRKEWLVLDLSSGGVLVFWLNRVRVSSEKAFRMRRSMGRHNRRESISIIYYNVSFTIFFTFIEFNIHETNRFSLASWAGKRDGTPHAVGRRTSNTKLIIIILY